MGLFSSKKTITVSSTAYNMAGDERDRPNFLKGTIFGSVMSNSPSLADDMTTSYFNGPGMKQRQFFRYADRANYVGLPTASIRNTADLDASVVEGEIPISPTPAGLKLSVTGAELVDGDFEPFIEKWILENHQERNGEDWLGEYEPSTDMFSVQFPNGDFYEWSNGGVYDKSARYIVSKYVEFLDTNNLPVEQDASQNGATVKPDVIGWQQNLNTGAFDPVTLQRVRTTVVSYNNGDPSQTTEDNVDADVPGQLNRSVEQHERTVTIGSSGLETQAERQIYDITGSDIILNDYTDVQVSTQDLGGGVIATTTSTTTGERVAPRWDWVYSTQDIFEGTVIGGVQMFIYEVGTGNATLDGLVEEADASGFQEFFPFFPVRIDNQSIDQMPGGWQDIYNDTKKMYRRAFDGKSFDSIIESVNDNPSIDDIDYAYVMFGVSLNVKEQKARAYAYEFMRRLIPFQRGGSGSAMSNLEAQVNAYEQALADFEAWEATDWSNTPWQDIPDRPEIPTVSPPPTSMVRLANGLGFDIRLTWIHAEEDQFNGNINAILDLQGDDVLTDNDFIFRPGPTFEWQERQTFWGNVLGSGGTEQEIRYTTRRIPSLYMYERISASTYRRMQIWGFQHDNVIYGGKSVTITAGEALADQDESGFIIPLHYPTMSDMNIVDYTQLTTANTWILFNSYEVTKQRWYERGIFKILLVILIIVIAVVVFPGAFAAGGGVLGGNLAVGAALGLTGTAALVAGVVANYIASIIISQVLSVVGTALFGEKWGAVFAAIAGMALGFALSGTNLFSAEGLMRLGSGLANAYNGFVQGDIAEMNEELDEDRQAYEDRMEYIDDLIRGLSGGNDLQFNPLFLTDTFNGNRQGRGGGYLPETADEFIRRTTMVGSDIIDITFSQVYDFVDVQQTLPRN